MVERPLRQDVSPPVSVACVLRSGGDYGPEWVYALKRGLNRNIPETVDWTFSCLTDIPAIPTMWRLPLSWDWPGWWAKMELFRPGLFKGPVVYFDLDTLIVDDISDLLSYRGEFGMIRGFYKRSIFQSGVMAWTPGLVSRALWDAWIKDPEGNRTQQRGDGRWINANIKKDRVDDLHELYPGQIVSFKVHARSKVPPGARVVCGHGQPRFSSPAAGWAHHQWKRIAKPPQHQEIS